MLCHYSVPHTISEPVPHHKLWCSITSQLVDRGNYYISLGITFVLDSPLETVYMLSKKV